jgi:glycosyltransferase involved in cell wall biosynthesis
MKKILFISHQNSLSGAPLVLLYFMQWLKLNHSNYQVDLLVLNEGKLSDDFKKVCCNYYTFSDLDNNFIFHQQLPLFFKRRVDDFLRKRFLRKIRNNKYDKIYANTVASLSTACLLKKGLNSELIVHVHELGTVINQILPNFKTLKGFGDKFIAVSDLVKIDLSEKWEVEIEKVKRIYEFSKVEKIELSKKKISEEFVVCGCGYVDWRKGTDIFIQIAKYIHSKNYKRKIKFVWIGKINFADRLVIEADIKKMGLIGFVDFVGEVPNPHDFLKSCDVFLLTSREDPFPLVCIEVGMLGKPIVCFERATGISEILTTGGGFVVPYLDIDKMAGKVEYYINNPHKIYEDGYVNQQSFSNFTPEKICPEIFAFLDGSITNDV